MKTDIQKLNKIIEESILLSTIVEGKRDIAALKKLGFKKIIPLYKKPLFEIVEQIAQSHKEVIILTDFDTEGKKLYSYLFKNLTKHGIKINNKLRNYLLRNTKLSHIEGLDTYLENNP